MLKSKGLPSIYRISQFRNKLDHITLEWYLLDIILNDLARLFGMKIQDIACKSGHLLLSLQYHS